MPVTKFAILFFLLGSIGAYSQSWEIFTGSNRSFTIVNDSTYIRGTSRFINGERQSFNLSLNQLDIIEDGCNPAPGYIYFAGSYFHEPSIEIRGMVFYSHDDGLTWTRKNVSGMPGVRDMHFLSDSIGFLCTDLGSIYRTSDAGVYWTKQYSHGYTNLDKFHFLNDSIGYCIGNRGTQSLKMATYNGGESWTGSGLICGLECSDLSIPNDSIVFTAYYENIYLNHLKDPSKSKIIPGPPNKTYSAIHFLNDSVGYVFSGNGSFNSTAKIYYTLDQGNTWTLQETPETVRIAYEKEVWKDEIYVTTGIGNTNLGSYIFTTKVDSLYYDNDFDNDNYTSDIDCDDANFYVNPGMIDILGNGIDEDCDGFDLLSNGEDLVTIEFRIYPNPTSQKINIELDLDEAYQVLLFDLQGNLVKKHSGQSEIWIDNLTTGLYIVQIRTENNTSQSKLIFKK